MISAQSLETNLTTLLGALPTTMGMRIESTAEMLNKAAEELGVELSSYGYIMYVIEKYGLQGVYRGMFGTKDSVYGYVKEAAQLRSSMPELLVNASNYAKNVFTKITDPDICMSRLKEMSSPHVLYVLFCGLGQPEQVEQYKEEAEEYFRRYPSTAELLPDKFRNVVEEFLSHESIE